MITTIEGLKAEFLAATYWERKAMIEAASVEAMNAMGDWRDGKISVGERENRRAPYFFFVALNQSEH